MKSNGVIVDYPSNAKPYYGTFKLASRKEEIGLYLMLALVIIVIFILIGIYIRNRKERNKENEQTGETDIDNSK